MIPDEAVRCPACGEVVEAGMDTCPQCGQRLAGPRLPREMREGVRRALMWLSDVWREYQSELDGLDERMKRVTSRIEALEGTRNQARVREREKLRVWLEEAMQRRGRLEARSKGAGDALLTFSHLWVLPDDVISMSKEEEGLRERLSILERETASLPSHQDRMEDWWKAHRRIQRDLFVLALGDGDFKESQEQTDALETIRGLAEDLTQRLDAFAKGPGLKDRGAVEALSRLARTIKELVPNS